MKEILRLNNRFLIVTLAVLTVFGLSSATFLSYSAMERERCIEVDFHRKAFKAGICSD